MTKDLDAWWEKLRTGQKSKLLAARQELASNTNVQSLLLETGLTVSGGGFSLDGEPAEWPEGVQEFLEAKATMEDDD